MLACSNLNELYVTVAKNRLYAKEGRAATNSLAKERRNCSAKTRQFLTIYNKVMAGGKMGSHDGSNSHRLHVLAAAGQEYVAGGEKNRACLIQPRWELPLEGQSAWWPAESADAKLPEFDRFNRQSYYIEIFNRGKTPFAYSVKSDNPWLKVSKAQGKYQSEDRIWVSIDWAKLRQEITAAITVTGPHNRRIIVHASINNLPMPHQETCKEFVESNGCVSIEAEHYSEVRRGAACQLAENSRIGTDSFCDDASASDGCCSIAGRSEPSSRVQNVSFQRR